MFFEFAFLAIFVRLAGSIKAALPHPKGHIEAVFGAGQRLSEKQHPQQVPAQDAWAQHARAQLAARNAEFVFDTVRPGAPEITLPRGGRVAVLVRGQSFRDKKGEHNHSQPNIMEDVSCPTPKSSNVSQPVATSSLVQQIIRPLQLRGNAVDVFVTDSPCNGKRARQTLQLALGASHPIAWSEKQYANQGENFKGVLQLFKTASKNKSYNLVIITRHDLVFNAPINQWRAANFFNFMFFSRCEPQAPEKMGGHHCVDDKAYVMPGRVFEGFASQIGQGTCFGRGMGRSCGHPCYAQVAPVMDAFGVAISFLTNERPQRGLREPNSLGNLY